MKKFLYILSLIFGCLLISQMNETSGRDEAVSYIEKSIMQDTNSADAQRNFEAISNELKSSNCLMPRRVSQTTNTTIELRTWKTLERSLQSMRLKSVNQFHKVTQHISTNQTVNISTLFCRMAEHVFTLRKLII